MSGPLCLGGRSSARQAQPEAARADQRSEQRAAGAPHTDEGSAIVEFVFLSVLLLIPLVYLVLTVAQGQAGAFAVSLASREAGRAFATAPDDASGEARAQAAAQLAFQDYGFTGGAITVRCDGTPCVRPEGKIQVTATLPVKLPLVPDFLVGALPTQITLTAEHVSTVDRFIAP